MAYNKLTISTPNQTENDLESLRRLLVRLVKADYGMVVIKHVAEASEFATYADGSPDECIDNLIDRLREDAVFEQVEES